MGGQSKFNTPEVVRRFREATLTLPDPVGESMSADDMKSKWPDLFSWNVPKPEPLPATELYTFLSAEASLDRETAGRRQWRGRDMGLLSITPELTIGINSWWWALSNLGPFDLRLTRTSLLRSVGFLDWISRSNYLEWASWCNNWAKKANVAISEEWKVLAELSTLGGFAKVKDESFLEDITDWVTHTRTHVSLFDGVSWHDAFEACARTVARRWFGGKGHLTLDIPTLDEFCSRPTLWGLAGSSFDTHGTRLYVHLPHNKFARARKSKYASCLALSAAEVKDRILSWSRQSAKAIAKRETKKVRAVISSDLDTYLCMKFVDFALVQMLKGVPDSTLWMSAEQRLDLAREMVSHEGVKLDTDQDKFDHDKELPDILTCVRILKDYVDPERSDVLDRILYRLGGGSVTVPMAGTAGLKLPAALRYKKLPIRNGVLSGWLWTAFLDTWINTSEHEMVLSVLRKFPSKNVVASFTAQGDDLRIRTRTLQTAVRYALVQQAIRLPINQSKTILGPRVDEFLRAVGDNVTREVCGYPARAINKLLWADPINERERPGTQRLQAIMERWNTICGRLGERGLPDAMLEDLGLGNHLSADDVNLWLRTPMAFGGAGLLAPDLRKDYLATTTAKRNTSGVRLIAHSAPGLVSIVERSNAQGVPVAWSTASAWALTKVRLNAREESQFSDWEDAEFTHRRWHSVAIARNFEASPPIGLLTPENREYLQMFPSDEACSLLDIPRPSHTSLRWWVGWVTGTLPLLSVRRWGLKSGALAHVAEQQSTGLAGGFFTGVHVRSWSQWQNFMATRETSLREHLDDYIPKTVTLLP